MRYLCLDPGRKRIGVAVSDETGLIATPLGVINVTSRDQVIKEILRYLEQENAGRLIMGLPLRMNGEEGIESARARDFAAQIARHTTVPIDFMDERLTSVEAERIMQESGGRKRKNARQRIPIDAHAAAIILQTYLDAERERLRPRPY
ncbi:MAG TPA: Holliday junction resolvase RuvX [Chloroflexia bacterium]|nr:Holliday junction resolvase RuvX [Chloroflexia bacterium]